MSGLRQQDGPLAVCIADIHATMEVPTGRKETPEEWIAVQRDRVIKAVRLAAVHEVPLLIAGDIFHVPKPEPAIINLMIEWLRAYDVPIVAVPGNHDLLHHRLADVGLTAFGTLERSKVFRRLSAASPIRVHGFAYGRKLHNLKPDFGGDRINIALIHRMVWKTGFNPYAGSDDTHVRAYSDILRGYDFAVFGDNHKAFSHREDPDCPWIVNCGCLIQRRLDELDYKPSAWILSREKGVNSVKRVELGNQRNKFRKPDQVIREIVSEGNQAVSHLIGQFENLSRVSASFLDELVSRATQIEKVSTRLRDHVISVVERAKA